MEERHNLAAMTGFHWGYWNYPYNYGSLFFFPYNSYIGGRCQDYGELDKQLLEDRDISQYVIEAIYAQPEIWRGDKKRISVKTIEGIVTLSGEVRFLKSKVFAYLEAFRTAGVRDVINKIKLKSPYFPLTWL